MFCFSFKEDELERSAATANKYLTEMNAERDERMAAMSQLAAHKATLDDISRRYLGIQNFHLI